MSKFSYINILKSEAKNLAAQSGMKQSLALEQVALRSGFSSYHELATVARKNPKEIRLMKAALGTDDLSQVVFQDDVLDIINDVVEEMLSAEAAETNAEGFMIEDLEVNDAGFDESTGILFIEIAFDYSGDQDSDRVYHGSTFHVSATLMLARRNSEWRPTKEFGGMELHDVESDVDRAHRLEGSNRVMWPDIGKGA